MDVLVRKLSEFGFCRLRANIGAPIVIHCVPGAGKSTLIRELIRKDRRFKAVTYGEPDHASLEGSGITSAATVPDCEYLIVDEYLAGPIIEQAFAIFGDPLQGGVTQALHADFTCSYSHRFGSKTSEFLRSLKFEVEAEGEDIVTIADIYREEPKGVVLYYEPEVAQLLNSHLVEAFCVTEVRGKTFEVVTFVTALNGPIATSRDLLFQALTRHKRELLILCPDATFAAT